MKRSSVLFGAASVIALGFCIQFALASTTAILQPTGDGNHKQFKPSTDSTHWTLVDETPCNGITDYNSVTTTNSGKRDSYTVGGVTTVGSGALISQIDIAPCVSRDKITTSSPVGTATTSLFYRWNGVDPSDYGTTSVASSTTPTQLATTTQSGLSLFKTSTSTLEVGMLYATGTKGIRLSRMVTVLTYTLTVPTAPSALAVNNISTTENDLTWTDNSNNELGFRIHLSSNGASYTQIATTVSWNATSYNDTTATSGNTYSYKVSAYNSAGEAFSSVVYSTITVSTDITSATTWQPFYVYVVNGAITVNSGVTLTVQPGTIVKFKTSSSGLHVFR